MVKFCSCILMALLLQLATIAQNQPAEQTHVRVSPRSNDEFGFQQFIPGNYIYFNVDILDNIYLLTTGFQLKKLSAAGDSLAIFNDVKEFGNPSYIDVSNPFKILVYYKNFSTVVILDRLLIKRSTINLRKQNIFSVKAIGTSYDNNIWLYDEQDNKLKKIDIDGKPLLESTDLRLLIDSVPSPSLITDSELSVYLYDEKKGFYIFDYYGALKNKLPFLNWQNVAIARNRMYGFSDSTLFSYEMKSLNLKKYQLPDFFNNFKSIKAMNNKVYLLKEDGLEIYNVK